MDSVIEQNYKNYEIIVIDGGSVDGTIDLLKTYKSNLSNEKFNNFIKLIK